MRGGVDGVFREFRHGQLRKVLALCPGTFIVHTSGSRQAGCATKDRCRLDCTSLNWDILDGSNVGEGREAARLGRLVVEGFSRVPGAGERRDGQRPRGRPIRRQASGGKALEGAGTGSSRSRRAVRRQCIPGCLTVRFREVVYVLHAFQTKSPKGAKTAKSDVELIEERLKIAQGDHEARYGKPR